VAITARTPTTGTAASSAGFTVTLPASTAVGDMLIVAVSSASVNAVATPSGWTLGGNFSAGTNEGLTVFSARYVAGLTLSFTNANGVSVWICNAFYESAGTGLIYLDGNPIGASNSTNNTTVPTGAPVATGNVAGDYEVLIYSWSSSGTITFNASTTKDSANINNGSSIAGAMGHANATLGANATATAWSATLSGNNTRKVGVGWLLMSVPTPTTAIGITDNFDDSSIGSQWTSYTNAGGTVTETTSLAIAPSGTSGAYNGVFSTAAYDLTGKYVYVQFAAFLNSTTGDVASFQAQIDSSNYLEWAQVDNSLYARRNVSGTLTSYGSMALPAPGTYVRIHESGGVVYMMYATNPIGTWTLMGRGPNPIAVTALYIVIQAGCYQAVASPGTARFDNLNYVSYKNLTGSASGLTVSPADTYRTTILADNPVAFYRMDETWPGQPGGDVLLTDSGPNNRWNYINKGYETYGITGALSRGDPAINFNGMSGAYAQTPYQPELNGSGPFTVEGWMRVASWPAVDAPLFSMGNAGTNDAFLHCVVRNGLPYFGFYGDDYAPSGSALSLNVWHHLVYVWEGPGTKVQRIYVDGVQWGTGRTSTNNLNVSSTNGYVARQTSYNLNGDLDEIALYGTALSQAQVTAHYNAASNSPIKLSAKRILRWPYGINTLDTSRGRAGVSGVPYSSVVMQDSPMLYWRLGEITGTTVNDSSGNGRGGTLNTGVLFQANGVLPFDTDGAADLPGTSNAYIQGPYLNVFQGGAAWTVEMWVNPSGIWGPGAAHPMFHCGDAQANNQWLTCECTGPIPELRFYGNDTTGGAPFLQPGRHHLVWQYEGTGTKIQRIYVDGVQWDNRTATANLNVLTGSQTGNGFRVGAGHFQGGAFNGRIDEVAVYPTFLSLTRIQAHYNAGWGVSPSPGISRKRSITALSAGTSSVVVTILKRPSLFGTAVGVATDVGQSSRKVLLGNRLSVGVAVTSGLIDKGASIRNITGITSGLALTTGTLTARRSLTGISAGKATDVGQPVIRRSVTGASTGIATDVGNPSVRKALVVASAGKAITSGQIFARRSIAVTAAGVATVSAQLTIRSSTIPPVTVAGKATTSATIGRKRQLVATSVGIATVAVSIVRKRALVATCVGVAATTGVMSHKISLISLGATGIATTTTAIIQRKRNLVASSVGIASTSTIQVLTKRAIAGTSNGLAVTSRAQLTTVRRLVGVTAGRAIVHGRVVNVGLILWNGSTFTLAGSYPVVLWDQAEFQTEYTEGETLDYVAYRDSTDQFNPIEP
jgi:hypothetical protein